MPSRRKFARHAINIDVDYNACKVSSRTLHGSMTLLENREKHSNQERRGEASSMKAITCCLPLPEYLIARKTKVLTVLKSAPNFYYPKI